MGEGKDSQEQLPLLFAAPWWLHPAGHPPLSSFFWPLGGVNGVSPPCPVPAPHAPRDQRQTGDTALPPRAPRENGQRWAGVDGSAPRHPRPAQR